MTFYNSEIAPCIWLYENVIDFPNKIVEEVVRDSALWKINHQDAKDWQPGEKNIGYDEYEIKFTFFSSKNILNLGKIIFDHGQDYALKNLLTVNDIDCTVRKYYSSPGFLELESSDNEDLRRRLTSILFLTDLNGGGELKFKNFDTPVLPKAGNLVIFPSSFAYSFKINRPRDDENFLIVSHFI